MAIKGKSGLGKGLDALLGDFSEAAEKDIRTLDIYLLDTNTEQPRKDFDEVQLRELSDSILRHGMVQPIVVRKKGERYSIVAGERRYRAARLAGLKEVPVVIRDMDEGQVMEIALIENLQREDLNPIEEAAGMRFLMQQHDLTQEEVAERLSKSRPAVANALRLLSLPESVQSMLRERRIQAGHARALVALGDGALQESLAREIEEKGLSVRAAEERARKLMEEKKGKKPPLRPTPDLQAAADRFRERLGTKVSIRGTEKKGKIVIEYYSMDDLQNIYDILLGGEEA